MKIRLLLAGIILLSGMGAWGLAHATAKMFPAALPTSTATDVMIPTKLPPALNLPGDVTATQSIVHQAATPTRSTCVVTAGAVFLRTKPTRESHAQEVAHLGNRLALDGSYKNNWRGVLSGGRKLWIHASLCELEAYR